MWYVSCVIRELIRVVGPTKGREHDLKHAIAMPMPRDIEPTSCASPYKSLDSCVGLSEKSKLSDERSSSSLSLRSMAGPELPVRLSRWSIASNKDSHDPWSMRESSGGSSSGSGEARGEAPQSTLTSASFRQRMDKDRSFTASAPPGARPPDSRKSGSTSAEDEENNITGNATEPRRHALSTRQHGW